MLSMRAVADVKIEEEEKNDEDVEADPQLCRCLIRAQTAAPADEEELLSSAMFLFKGHRG